jgi:hypothetical protein
MGTENEERGLEGHGRSDPGCGRVCVRCEGMEPIGGPNDTNILIAILDVCERCC